MKLNTTRLLIILVVLIGVFALVKLTRNTGRSSSFKTELVNFSVDAVDKVEITSPAETVRLSKNGDSWTVETAQGTKTAMEGNVSSMLSTINTIEPTRLAARSESKWKDFSVDSTGTRVMVSGDGKVLTDIVLGRFGVEGQRSFYTYVRLQEDVDVYVAANFMKMSVSATANDFRNNIMARINKDSLVEISFNYPDSALVLNNLDGTWMNGTVAADSAAMASYLSGLSLVTSKKFSNPSSALNPELNVTYSFIDGKEIQLSAYRETLGWTLTSSENTQEAWMDEGVFGKVFAASSSF